MSKILLIIGKLIFIVYFFFVGWYQAIYETLSGVVAPLAAAMIAVMLLYIYVARIRYNDIFLPQIKWWTVFAIFTGISGLFVAQELRMMLNSWMIYCAFLAMTVFVILAIKRDGNANFFINLFCILSVMYAVRIITGGAEVGEYIRLSENTNRNADGILMCLGIFAFLYRINPKKAVSIVFNLAVSCFLLYAIVFTASRKALICAVFLIAIWAFLFVTNNWKDFKVSQKAVVIVIIIALLAGALFVFMPYLRSSYVYARLTDDSVVTGDEARAGMYAESVEFFWQSPLAGLGYNQFRVHSRYNTYSHSTYAELISCTGAIGTILWLVPMLMILFKLWKQIRQADNVEQRNKILLCFATIAMLLALGTGVILPYNFQCVIIIAIILGTSRLTELQRAEKNDVEKKLT
ncbi:MAG: O-antigen ligase family protein [Clostridia bacterium]|nr:O-antigen ligase family protein [Clostridia bacterium]